MKTPEEGKVADAAPALTTPAQHSNYWYPPRSHPLLYAGVLRYDCDPAHPVASGPPRSPRNKHRGPWPAIR